MDDKPVELLEAPETLIEARKAEMDQAFDDQINKDTGFNDVNYACNDAPATDDVWEQRDLRRQALEAASKIGGRPSDILEAAEKFYAFLKGDADG